MGLVDQRLPKTHGVRVSARDLTNHLVWGEKRRVGLIIAAGWKVNTYVSVSLSA